MTPPATLPTSAPSIFPDEPEFSYGLTDETRQWDTWIETVRSEAREPITKGEPSLRQRFEELANQWREETEHHSSSTSLFMHPAYQKIIGMGAPVLPLLLKDLDETGSLWFWALRAISNENPVSSRDRGKVERMRAAWLAWGVREGLF